MKQRNNAVRKISVNVLGKEKYRCIILPVFAIMLSFMVGAIVILVLGKNPLQVYGNLLQGSGLWRKEKYAGEESLLTDFFSFLDGWTPMIFAALAVAVALKAGLFNIGVSGQMLAAGFIGTVTVGYSALSSPVAKPLVVLVCLVAGGLIGGSIGLLKHKFNVNEVVSTIMINYIVEYVTAFFISTKYMNWNLGQSKSVSDAARLTLKNVAIGDWKVDVPLGILLAIVVTLVLKFIFDKTTFGYEIKAIGSNEHASQYAGMNVGRKRIIVMMISGGLSGLAGATYYLGYLDSIQPKVLADLGFDAIVVSLLGDSNPMGILASSFLMNMINKGSAYMRSQVGWGEEIVAVITVLLLLFCSCQDFIGDLVKRNKWEEAK